MKLVTASLGEIIHVFGGMTYMPHHGTGVRARDKYTLTLGEIPFGCLLAGCIEKVLGKIDG